MRNILSVLFLFLFAFNVFSQDKFALPNQNIVGAEQPIPLGELVDLSISPIKDKVPNLDKVVVSWKIYDGDNEKKFRASGDGIFFGAGIKSKKLLVLASVSYLYKVKEGDKITDADIKNVLLSATLQIGDQVLPAPPNPVDPKPVVPDDGEKLPAGRFNLSKIAYDNVYRYVDASNRSGAKVYANSLEGVASSIAAGVYDEVEPILKATKEANDQAFKQANIPTKGWNAYGEAMQDIVYDLYKNKKLITVYDFRDAWLEISRGLKAIK
jgi:hypothetical protein